MPSSALTITRAPTPQTTARGESGGASRITEWARGSKVAQVVLTGVVRGHLALGQETSTHPLAIPVMSAGDGISGVPPSNREGARDTGVFQRAPLVADEAFHAAVARSAPAFPEVVGPVAAAGDAEDAADDCGGEPFQDR
jgi:hypothetical protein